jgi:hypothetical protein
MTAQVRRCRLGPENAGGEPHHPVASIGHRHDMNYPSFVRTRQSKASCVQQATRACCTQVFAGSGRSIAGAPRTVGAQRTGDGRRATALRIVPRRRVAGRARRAI